jgi:hypothetical protein
LLSTTRLWTTRKTPTLLLFHLGLPPSVHDVDLEPLSINRPCSPFESDGLFDGNELGELSDLLGNAPWEGLVLELDETIGLPDNSFFLIQTRKRGSKMDLVLTWWVTADTFIQWCTLPGGKVPFLKAMCGRVHHQHYMACHTAMPTGGKEDVTTLWRWLYPPPLLLMNLDTSHQFSM